MENKFEFILVNPQLGENIGSCARALKNFGFSKLNIISPRDPWPNTKARMTSVGAFNIIKSAKVYNNVEDVVEKFDLIFATTARKRDVNKKHISMVNFIKLLTKLIIEICFLLTSLFLAVEAKTMSNFLTASVTFL